jgi:LmbE family N-acetylglucosaminyl deacetylase
MQGSTTSPECLINLQSKGDKPAPDKEGASETDSSRDEPGVRPEKEATITEGIHIPQSTRLLLFSPHPDDESIAAAGLIQQVLQGGGQVLVVFMTNGDGYQEGVTKFLKRTPSTEDFVQFGKQRHQEALNALCQLGLDNTSAVFLGFPDGGLDHLWAWNWSDSEPFTSPYTHFSKPQYKESIRKWIAYAGDDLQDEIVRTIRRFSPDWIVIPDLRDNHADHVATGVFVLDALQELNATGRMMLSSIEVFTYLVHYPGYPDTNSWMNSIVRNGGENNPAERTLSSTSWIRLAMSSKQLEAKRLALEAHETQQLVLGELMKKFLVPWEVFGRLDDAQVLSVPGEYAVRFGRHNS